MYNEEAEESETKYVVCITTFLILIMLWVVTGSITASTITFIPTRLYPSIIIFSALVFSIISCLLFYARLEELTGLKYKPLYLISLAVTYILMAIECQIWLYVCTTIMLLNLIKVLKAYLLYKYNEVN